jgi:hypothetical protein
MARLQILELPTIYRDEGPDETPYILVIDQVDDETAADIARWPDDIAKRTGARHVLCFTETVDIPANETPVVIDEAFKRDVQEWAEGTNGTLGRIVEAISHPRKRPMRDAGNHAVPDA